MPQMIGIVDGKKNIDKSLLDCMIASIKHEGRYKIDKYINNKFALARVL